MKNVKKNVHEGIRYQCVSCDKSFTNSRNLARHPKKTSHEKIRFECDLCEKSFSDSGTLKNHVQVIHQGKVLLVIIVTDLSVFLNP